MALIAFEIERHPKNKPSNAWRANEIVKKVIRYLRDNFGHSNDLTFQKAVKDLIAKFGTDSHASAIVDRVFHFQEAAKAVESVVP